MKIRITEVLLIMGLISVLTSLTGCGLEGHSGKGSKAVDNESGITGFNYSYSAMRYRYSYEVKKDDGKTLFVYEDSQYGEYGEMTLECGDEIFDRLNKLYLDCRLAEWDGFDMNNKKVLDGDMFSLKISFADGENLSAHGSNAKPDRFGEFETGMKEILKPYCDEVLKLKHDEKVAAGINGELVSVLVNFTQHGNAGSDRINVLIQKESIREKNFSVEIKSAGGSYFPEGEINHVLHVPDAELGLDDVRKIIDDLRLIEWSDYDKAAEDYNNSEWFQVSFSFDDNTRIGACGTEHPDNYEAFRDAFLSWLAGRVDVLAEKYNDKTEE